ncbi:uncharacterized protein BO87DRAFT_390899 [Aspergillus neoniger CBS 115656]|uniref:Uncharacterized protein n=1 Tax=Aspergillus neoniger (strain CBS 115656) TaxID=1448310 RepID=A0A318Y7K9_ASPNB|nr:hypothetical protein BO87DRAFT_390899 [Aspergillus neoniger CBS 115656]PYH29537.1 hypothetical protein BO87DRAFT_390899 [Aspergillus neoniger CBS 115656]
MQGERVGQTVAHGIKCRGAHTPRAWWFASARYNGPGSRNGELLPQDPVCMGNCNGVPHSNTKLSEMRVISPPSLKLHTAADRFALERTTQDPPSSCTGPYGLVGESYN